MLGKRSRATVEKGGGKRRRTDSAPKAKANAPVGRLAKVEKKVNSLSRQIENITSTFIYRRSNHNAFTSNASVMLNVLIPMGTVTLIEQALANAKILNNSTGDLDDVDLTMGTTSKEYRISNWHKTLTIRANYLTAVEYTIYSCIVKRDTSQTPLQLFAEGAAAASFGNGIADEMLFPTDFDVLTDVYTIKRMRHGIIQGGQEIRVPYYHNKPHSYDVLSNSFGGSNYLQQLGSMAFLCRFKGLLAHDSGATDNQGYGPAFVDIAEHSAIKVEYDGGGDWRFVRVNQGIGPMSGGAAITQFRFKINQAPKVSNTT